MFFKAIFGQILTKVIYVKFLMYNIIKMRDIRWNHLLYKITINNFNILIFWLCDVETFLILVNKWSSRKPTEKQVNFYTFFVSTRSFKIRECRAKIQSFLSFSWYYGTWFTFLIFSWSFSIHRKKYSQVWHKIFWSTYTSLSKWNIHYVFYINGSYRENFYSRLH